ncbi:uncharacterized protein LOC144505617 [Mustelus asterias]
MSQVLKTVILLFILVSVECRIPPEPLIEIMNALQREKVNKSPCGNIMIHEVKFNMSKCSHGRAEVFCKSAKALKNFFERNTCQDLDITGFYLQTKAFSQDSNCAINEAEEVELKTFLHNLRRFVQCVKRHE